MLPCEQQQLGPVMSKELPTHRMKVDQGLNYMSLSEGFPQNSNLSSNDDSTVPRAKRPDGRVNFARISE